MKLLELFSGTGSVGKIARELGYEVVSLDLQNADIETDILNWNYKELPKDSFHIIWASPPCDTFSSLKNTWIGRKLKRHDGRILTKEIIQEDIDNIGLPILRKTEEIINYFTPKYYFLENPQTGKMKDYVEGFGFYQSTNVKGVFTPFYDVDYCKYALWGCRKRTRIWTNLKGFHPKICKKDCENMNERGVHRANIGCCKLVIDENGKAKKIKSHGDRVKYKDYKNIAESVRGGGGNRDMRHRIPPKLINELLELCILKNKINETRDI